VEVEEGGDDGEADRRKDAGHQLARSAHPVNEELERMVGEGKEHGHGERGGPGRFGFAKRFSEGAVKAGRDGAEEKLGLHRGQRGRRAGREIGEEEDGGAQERAEEGGLPVPAPAESG